MLLSVRTPLPTHQHPKEEPLLVGALCRHTYKGDLDDLCSAPEHLDPILCRVYLVFLELRVVSCPEPSNKA